MNEVIDNEAMMLDLDPAVVRVLLSRLVELGVIEMTPTVGLMHREAVGRAGLSRFAHLSSAQPVLTPLDLAEVEYVDDVLEVAEVGPDDGVA